VFLGLAAGTHAEYFFPRERSTRGERKWALWLLYFAAAAAIVACLVFRSNVAALASIAGVLLACQPAAWQARRRRAPEDRRILRAVRLAKYSVGAIAFGLVAAPLAGMRLPQYALFAVASLVLIPAAYFYTIANYRLLDLDLRVRRSVQYSVASVGWALLSVCALLAVLWYLPQVRLPLPNLNVSGSSVELLDTPMDDQRRSVFEKGALMLLAIGAAFLFRAIGRGGQRWIANKFHRTAYDYRRASRELADVMSTRLDLDGLADGLIQTLVRLMPLKRAGVVFVHGPRSYCGGRAHGFAPEEWTAFCASTSADIVQVAAKATSEIDAEYTFPRLRRTLETADIKYLFPIRSHERLVGVVLVGEKRSEAAFEDDDFQFLGAAAHQVSAGVENAFLYEELAEQERLRHELEIARRIQLESLPQFTPSVEGLDIAGISVPAFEVGGDYYDYLDGEPRQLTIVVGDVSGKGTSAALYMSKLQGILRSLHAFKLPPHELFTRTNELLSRDLERRAFVTALGAFFHTTDRRAVLARAGHLPLYLYRAATGAVERVLPRGVGFGLSHCDLFAEELEEREVTYVPGDVFLFVTDGITECQTTRGEEFGEERLIATLRDLAGEATAAGIRDRLVESVRAFAGEAEQVDDQTVVVVRATA
jgi:serine phosphatase RsbU (regulator of sigma subunit)